MLTIREVFSRMNQPQLGAAEVIALHDGCLWFIPFQGEHRFRYFALDIAQHRPSVDPSAGHECKHATYTTAILKDDAVPVAVIGVNDSPLSDVRKTAEVRL